ncbi:SDR family oxidoreductase [uncultured Clostridium sp.]|uniref:SDR family NAD(P)-dependent oxidoreductase n=1 Tax=uncultured Clostridium sp. TaxID=59620 RepID=UPI0025E11672|nr:SDR family oxidoreductase [uncultured Clostridium sp.]
MKNILIIGAANGIGYYLVKQLLSEGYNVTVLDLKTDNLDSLCEKYDSLLSLTCDVRDLKQMKVCVSESVRKYGSIDCAVHNACMCTFGSMEQTGEQVYHDVMEVNYYGALHLSRAVLPYMKSLRNGKVIFTSSCVGIMGFINISPYSSSKGAIEALAKCLNIEYQNYAISFHIFHPPLIRTKSAEPLPVPKEFMADPEKVGIGLAKHIRSKSFIICHSLGQKIQILICCLFPVKMGKLMSKMTAGYMEEKDK